MKKAPRLPGGGLSAGQIGRGLLAPARFLVQSFRRPRAGHIEGPPDKGQGKGRAFPVAGPRDKGRDKEGGGKEAGRRRSGHMPD